MYDRLRLSSEFSADEVDHWDALMKPTTSRRSSRSATLSTPCSTRIDARDKRKHDAAERKAEYYASKGG